MAIELIQVGKTTNKKNYKYPKLKQINLRKNSDTLATPSDISEFEKYIGYKLPPDYVDFLKKYNGGVLMDRYIYTLCKEKYYPILQNNLPIYGGEIHPLGKHVVKEKSFFGSIFGSKPDNNLYSIYDHFIKETKQIPKFFLPIQSNYEDFCVCIDLDTYQVYIIDVKYKAGINLCNSFNEYLNSLHDEYVSPCKDTDKPTKKLSKLSMMGFNKNLLNKKSI